MPKKRRGKKRTRSGPRQRAEQLQSDAADQTAEPPGGGGEVELQHDGGEAADQMAELPSSGGADAFDTWARRLQSQQDAIASDAAAAEAQAAAVRERARAEDEAARVAARLEADAAFERTTTALVEELARERLAVAAAALPPGGARASRVAWEPALDSDGDATVDGVLRRAQRDLESGRTVLPHELAAALRRPCKRSKVDGEMSFVSRALRTLGFDTRTMSYAGRVGAPAPQAVVTTTVQGLRHSLRTFRDPRWGYHSAARDERHAHRMAANDQVAAAYVTLWIEVTMDAAPDELAAFRRRFNTEVQGAEEHEHPAGKPSAVFLDDTLRHRVKEVQRLVFRPTGTS